MTAFECASCGATFELLDPKRRAWLLYGCLVGVGAVGFGVFLGSREGAAVIFFVVGLIALGVSLGLLVRDAWTRGRATPVP